MQAVPSQTLEIAPDRWAALPDEARSALLRSDLYRALGWAFLYPEPSSLESMWRTVSNVDQRGGAPDTHAQTLAAWRQLRQFARSTVDQLRLEYDTIFGHTMSAECPPYETQYGAGIIFAQAQRLGDIAAFYRAFGVQVLPEAHERPDHIAAELEFMGLLAFREGVTIIEEDAEHLVQVREAQRKFLTQHLVAWAHSFAERLARRANSMGSSEGGFYVSLAGCLDAMLRNELQHYQVAPDSVPRVEPATVDFEPEGCSFACGPSGEPVLAQLPT